MKNVSNDFKTNETEKIIFPGKIKHREILFKTVWKTEKNILKYSDYFGIQ